MKPVRVLYTIPELCVGGAERQLLALACGLDRARFDPAIAVLRPGGALEPEAREAGVTVIEAPRLSRFDVMPVLRIAGRLIESRVRVIHSFLFLDGLYARPAALLAGTPVRVASLRGVDYAPGTPHCYVDRALKECTTCLVSNSSWMRQTALAWGMTRVRIEVIPNGVDFAPFAGGGDRHALRKSLGLSGADFVVGIVGRLSLEKDHPTFLRCAAEVVAACPRAAFVIVGDGPERQRLERMVGYLGLEDRVRMTGWRADIPDLLSGLNVLALTSTSESFPNAILEAMAGGLPVVATRVGGVAELVAEGETGLLAPAGDAHALAQHLLKLEADTALRARLGQAGWQRARQQFSVERMVQRYEDLYEDLLGIRTRVETAAP